MEHVVYRHVDSQTEKETRLARLNRQMRSQQIIGIRPYILHMPIVRPDPWFSTHPSRQLPVAEIWCSVRGYEKDKVDVRSLPDSCFQLHIRGDFDADDGDLASRGIDPDRANPCRPVQRPMVSFQHLPGTPYRRLLPVFPCHAV